MHATTVCLGMRGVIIRGASGAGKSTLALALLHRWQAAGTHAALVADDQTVVAGHGEALIARPHPTLAGVMERRGLGFIGPPTIPHCRVGLVVDLVPAAEAPRLPNARESALIAGCPLPRLALPAGDLFAASETLHAALASDGTMTHVVKAPGPPPIPTGRRLDADR
ncbi:MAG: hypothetical protein AAGF49_07530 [Pseudomonadota bacterium]